MPSNTILGDNPLQLHRSQHFPHTRFRYNERSVCSTSAMRATSSG